MTEENEDDNYVLSQGEAFIPMDEETPPLISLEIYDVDHPDVTLVQRTVQMGEEGGLMINRDEIPEGTDMANLRVRVITLDGRTINIEMKETEE